MRIAVRDGRGRSSWGRRVALLVALVAPAAAGEERFPELGVALEPPPRYAILPVPSNEPWVVLKYVAENRARKGPQTRAILELVRIPWQPDPDPLPKVPPINSVERYFEQRLTLWTIGVSRAATRPKDGWECQEMEVRWKSGQTGVGVWAYAQRNSEGTWLLIGRALQDELEDEVKAWRRTAERLELFPPVPPKDSAKWTRFYEKNPQFPNPVVRLRIRARLVDGWEAEDTENYLWVTSTRKETLVSHLQKRLEGIRRAYVERFPPVREITAVPTVRLCKDQEEYHRYGGPTGTAGYWSPAAEELVLFVFENDEGWQSGKENSRSVMYHEGFHQYIHVAVGELAPHSWFNEGYGDYFGGANFTQTGKLGRIDPHPWRLGRIQDAIQRGRHASWSRMIRYTKEEYYGAERSTNYAMGWSMIYFLEECRAARKHPLWKKILPTYFETLKAAHFRERERLAAAGKSEDEEAVARAAEAAREGAVKAAFEDVDLHAIEEAWREYVLELKGPR